MANVPVFYVHGNHDGLYREVAPEGCVCIEDRIVQYKGLRIAGLGGCMQYNGGEHQYTEEEMHRRCVKLGRKIQHQYILDRLNRREAKRSIDIFVTHASLRGIQDAEDLTHHGFESFRMFLDRWHPAYMLHGHVHANYSCGAEKISRYGETQIINTYETFLLEV